MSAAFQLDFSGPAVRCSYPGCVADSFHDGEHQFALVKTQFPLPAQYNRTCPECGIRFVVLFEGLGAYFHTCGQAQCLVNFARKHAPNLPVSCPCAQRAYPHEVSMCDSVAEVESTKKKRGETKERWKGKR